MQNFKITQVLKDLLSDKQIAILEAYLDNWSIRDMSRKLKVKQEDILLEFIFLGKKLCLYELGHFRITPDMSKLGGRYMEGFNDFRQKQAKEIEYVRIKEGKKRPNTKRRKTKRS